MSKSQVLNSSLITHHCIRVFERRRHARLRTLKRLVVKLFKETDGKGSVRENCKRAPEL